MSRRLYWLVGMILVVALAFPLVALADNVVSDGDNTTPIGSNPLNLGSICAGQTVSGDVLVAVKRNGNYPSTNVFQNGSSVTVSISSVSGSGLSAAMSSPNKIILPSNWGDLANNTFSNSVSSTVTLSVPNLPDGTIYSGAVTYQASGPSSGGGSTNRADTMIVTGTIKQCDSIPPTTSATGTKAGGGSYTSDTWTNQNVTVSLIATDNEGGSGVKQITYSASGAQTISTTTVSGASVAVNVTTEGTTTISYFATDNAGNTESVKTFIVKIDKTAPTASASASPAPNAAGWNNTDVTVTFSGTDATSGIDSCSSPIVLSSEGTDLSASGTCTDKAGNVSATATASGIKIDKTKPSVTIGAPTAATYMLGQVVNASYSCSDGGSGIASCVGAVSSGSAVDTGTTGSKTFTVTARDVAGNENSQSVTYNVVAYTINLYGAPKSARAGSTIPIKLWLGDSTGGNCSSSSLVVNATGYRVALSDAEFTPADDSGNANPDDNFRYDASLGGYIFNFSTKGLTGGKYVLVFRVDGKPDTSYSVPFEIK